MLPYKATYLLCQHPIPTTNESADRVRTLTGRYDVAQVAEFKVAEETRAETKSLRRDMHIHFEEGGQGIQDVEMQSRCSS